MIDVAHELRTPLTNIRGYLEALIDGVMAPLPETLSLLHDETLRLIRLAEDVLELARADAAGGRLHFEPIDLRAEVDAALAVYSPSFAQNAVTVKLHTPDGVPAVAADRRRIARVLRNLTENAAQYTPPQGNVDIRIETQGARVRVEFANDGGELTPADLPYIFERLCRGDKISGSQVRCGSGSICRALLLLLLGTVLRKSLHDLYSDVKRPLTSLLTVWTS